MSKKRVVQIIAIAFLVIAVILLIPNTKWTENTSVWGFISLVFGTLGSIVSIFIPTTYTFYFIESDWQKNSFSNDFSLHIAAKKHGIGNSPQVQTFLRNGKTYEEVGVSSHHDEKGNITVGANMTFSGKVIII
jgi:hypothetical protein